MSSQNVYVSPLVARYAGREMTELFAPLARARVWREVWIALAKAQHELGAPVSAEQVAALEATQDSIDLERVAEIEAETRHDVMAHIKAWAEVCPEGAPVVHLGATSQFVNDNSEAVIQRRALQVIRRRLVQLVRALADVSEREANTATLGYTHFQIAQPTTVGKRSALWLQDIVWDLEAVEACISGIPCRGAKGTTGTQASFLALFGDDAKVAELDQSVATKLGFVSSVALSGQSSPRKLDARMADALAGIGITLGKMGRDVRLLCHTGELREPFGKGQVGSSAMPYKQNPMRAERICALSRLLLHHRSALAETAATQWLERSLDDSAARRLTIPDLFLIADGVLRVAVGLVRGLRVNAPVVTQRLEREAAFLAVEKLLIRGVARGGDRQELHEALRIHALAARDTEDPSAAFRALLAGDPTFEITEDELVQLSAPDQLVGRAPAQVANYLADVVKPLLAARADVSDDDDPINV